MQIFNESPVLADEIDRLGHMNVQFYMTRVGRANRELLESLGVSDQSALTALRHTDVFSRFHQEQFEGATLRVSGGLIALAKDRARAYFEIRNAGNKQLAASFIIESTLVTLATREPCAFPANVEQHPDVIEVPAQGGPRSLQLGAPRTDVTLARLEERVVDPGPTNTMSGRFEYGIDPEACDEYGFLREGVNPMFGGRRRPPADEDGSFGPPILTTDEGHRFGWAIMETRSVSLQTPRANDTLVSVGADVALARKSRQSRRWTFVRHTGKLIGIHDHVAVALDLDERRAIEIPNSMRRDMEQNYLPDLA